MQTFGISHVNALVGGNWIAAAIESKNFSIIYR